MQTREFKGFLSAQGKYFAIVISRFNEFLSKELLAGAIDCLERHNADGCDIYWTPGCFEIPGIAKQLALTKRYSAIIALGVIIRGDTPHAEYIAAEVSKGLAKINYDTGIPTVFGIITADTIEQAIERSGTKAGNKGYLAAHSAIEMADLTTKLG
ncbi:MAG: 6,7-dimethyl-8-ribityllumazine synthase [candidate division WOR-3 bacterium]|nr:6,7-dimethyl-8-ribityllumazine synthase [candidate division WOR-3 bacterium]MCX7756934.1 6,7-dimethyl-8-ribityllumazine synthase [candidate division WOR-3 bacterium]MDW7988423.1 6,7-dimethyl-8-ribityllumazine synthase [candidate division WOR-3 bacterium]